MLISKWYVTFSKSTIRIAHRDLLIRETKTLKQDEHTDLHGSDRQNVISYVHRELLYCCMLFRPRTELT
jgi:hypothetical protein